MSDKPEDMERDFLDSQVADLRKQVDEMMAMKSDKEYFLKRSADRLAYRAEQAEKLKGLSFSSNALWGCYDPEVDAKQFMSMVLPVFSTTTGASYDSLVDGSLLLSYQTVNDPNKIYSRIDNNTCDHLAMKIAAMEGCKMKERAQGLVTSSGMSAIFMSTLMFLESGDEFVSSNRCYGGTEQLFSLTYKKMNWNVIWIENPENYDEWESKITPKTKFVFVETPSNPFLYVADIRRLAEIAHKHGIPLLVDNTCASPALQRPLELGADIVIHSVSKIMCSSGRAIAGAIVGKKKIVTNMPELVDDFAVKCQGGHFRNLGPCLHPPSAAAVWDNLNSLEARLRMVSASALKIATFLEGHPKIESVKYPGLTSHPQHELAKKQMKFEDGTNGYGFLFSFKIKGDLETTKKFARTFKFGMQVTDLGRDYTAWVHNASTTHGQATQEVRDKAGVADNMIRYSAGLEGADDAIAALKVALEQL